MRVQERSDFTGECLFRVELLEFDPWGIIPRRVCRATGWWTGRMSVSAVESIDATLTLHSEVLGLELRTKGLLEMRFHDSATDETLLSDDEVHIVRPRSEPTRKPPHCGRKQRRGGRPMHADDRIHPADLRVLGEQ